MAKEAAPKRFRPERPIFLSRDNTGYKSDAEVLLAIEKLRDRGWLCCFSAEKIKPFHLSFNIDSEFQEFKKDAKTLGIALVSPPITQEMIDDLEMESNTIIKPEPNKSSEDPHGKIHIE